MGNSPWISTAGISSLQAFLLLVSPSGVPSWKNPFPFMVCSDVFGRKHNIVSSGNGIG